MVALFSLPNGIPASFYLHNFQNENLTDKSWYFILFLFSNGGRITHDEDTADVVLTTSRDEYKSLKDRYAISRKTMCINSRRFQLAPLVEKGVPGRKLTSRRTEFTDDDDDHLCQYIAEVLPEKDEGGRTGHFIYVDLMRRADEFGQYTWARRHTKDGWRERYRKNRHRLDERIADIVKENPPAPDEKGRYRSRRYGRTDQDDELNAVDDEFHDEERGDSATDNEDGPVHGMRIDALRQEEEDDDDEEQVALHQPGPSQRDPNASHEEEEEAEEQALVPQPRPRPQTRAATRQSRTSLVQAPRRRDGAAQVVEEQVPGDFDATIPDANVDDEPAEEPGASPSRGTKVRTKRRARPKARQPWSPFPPRSPLQPIDSPETGPAAPRSISDEFKAHSDDEGDMHEVEADLQMGAVSRGSLDLQTSQRLQAASLHTPAAGDDQDDDDSDAELLAHVKKLDVRVRKLPGTSQNQADEFDHESSEEIFPSPGTRAGAEKKRRTQVAKAAPYVPPRGTRAASMIEKEKAPATLRRR
ncbi:hypothetical protein BGW80DRAFT_1374592 [Lactifluus volemus]|nr:hypothetical protein BGW80DRAFT_1374592 [Lactifluus volemus]